MNFLKIIKSKLKKTTIRTLNLARLHLSHSNTRIGLVSCNRWLGKVYDDLLLQKAFLDAGFKAELISWQDSTIDFSKYDALLVTSMWGYQNFLPDLLKWLDGLDGTKIFNSRDIILENLDKTKQTSLLKKHGLPVVPTTVIKKRELESPSLASTKAKFKDFPLVIKPSISGGGENTFLLQNQNELNKILPKLQKINSSRELLVQPFLPEISHGEISVIAIDGEIVNAAVRFPGVLDGTGRYMVKPLPLDELDGGLIKLCQQVIATQSQDQLYTRIDTVKKDGKNIIMEVESFEPQLFYYLLRGGQREEMLSAMVTAVKKRLS